MSTGCTPLSVNFWEKVSILCGLWRPGGLSNSKISIPGKKPTDIARNNVFQRVYRKSSEFDVIRDELD